MTPTGELIEANRHAKQLRMMLSLFISVKNAIHISYTEKIHRMTDCKQLTRQTIKTSAQNAVFAQSDDDIRLAEIGLQQCDIRRSGSQDRLNLLLWLASVETVCCLSYVMSVASLYFRKQYLSI